MAIKDDDYFESTRPWSQIKNGILQQYLTPYVPKVAKRGQPLLFIDAFAGPGKNFADNSPGSPLLICQAASKFNVNWSAHFFNKKVNHHESLSAILNDAGWGNNTFTHLGDAVELINSISTMISNESVFLYLDPFGLTCDFDTLSPFLNRNHRFSTEILINLNAGGLHRLAMRNAINDGNFDENQVKQNHEILTRVLGGDYWKEALLTNNIETAKEREEIVINGYMEKLKSTGYLKYAGSCPVQERLSSATKYYMIFASQHSASIVLFNDAMCKAFNSYMHQQENPLFAFNGQSWKDWRNTDELVQIISDYVCKYPKHSREDLWVYIVQENFMRFTESEYKKSVTKAVNTNLIKCTTPIDKNGIRTTKRLNDKCVLEPVITQ